MLIKTTLSLTAALAALAGPAVLAGQDAATTPAPAPAVTAVRTDLPPEQDDQAALRQRLADELDALRTLKDEASRAAVAALALARRDPQDPEERSARAELERMKVLLADREARLAEELNRRDVTLRDALTARERALHQLQDQTAALEARLQGEKLRAEQARAQAEAVPSEQEHAKALQYLRRTLQARTQDTDAGAARQKEYLDQLKASQVRIDRVTQDRARAVELADKAAAVEAKKAMARAKEQYAAAQRALEGMARDESAVKQAQDRLAKVRERLSNPDARRAFEQAAREGDAAKIQIEFAEQRLREMEKAVALDTARLRQPAPAPSPTPTPSLLPRRQESGSDVTIIVERGDVHVHLGEGGATRIVGAAGETSIRTVGPVGGVSARSVGPVRGAVGRLVAPPAPVAQPKRPKAPKAPKAPKDPKAPKAPKQKEQPEDAAGVTYVTTTDDEGRFRVNPLAPGRYIVNSPRPVTVETEGADLRLPPQADTLLEVRPRFLREGRLELAPRVLPSLELKLPPRETPQEPEAPVATLAPPAVEYVTTLEVPQIRAYVNAVRDLSVPSAEVVTVIEPAEIVAHVDADYLDLGVRLQEGEVLSYSDRSKRSQQAPSQEEMLQRLLELVEGLKADLGALRAEVRALQGEIAPAPRRRASGGGDR